MKYLPYLLIALFSFFLLPKNDIKAQTISPGNVILTPYIGLPNMKTLFYKIDDDNKWEANGIFHYGLSGEYVISQRVGIGFDAIYSPLRRSMTDHYSVYDGIQGNMEHFSDEYKLIEDKLRIYINVNIHLLKRSSKWDLYIQPGIGYNHIFTKAYMNDEKISYSKAKGENTLLNDITLPIAGKLAVGTRVYLTDYFALNAQLGIGGPPISFGASFRIGQKAYNEDLNTFD